MVGQVRYIQVVVVVVVHYICRVAVVVEEDAMGLVHTLLVKELE